MAIIRLSEVHGFWNGERAVTERAVLDDTGGVVTYRRTNPADGDAVLEERPATDEERRRLPDPEVATLRAVLAKADADVTAAEVKALLLRFLRRRDARGEL